MDLAPARHDRLEQLRDLFAADATKLVLSVLIIVSVLPLDWVKRAALVFFFIFAAELALRLLLLRQSLKERAINRVEIVVLLLDAVATISFLPLEGLLGVQWEFLRLIRLSRMLMLLSYWSPIGKEIWIILMKRERRYQLLFVGAMVVILTFVSAILINHLGVNIDFTEKKKLADETFWTTVWWTFRQIQDSGNMVKAPSASLVFVFSLLLTTVGIFVIAFFIGIGTSVVSELVTVGREKRIGLRHHSVIANLGSNSGSLVGELVSYYTKSFRAPKLVTLGTEATRPDFMYSDLLRRVRYRSGTAGAVHDLLKVDTDRARRVILLGEGEEHLDDSEVIAQILSVRQINRHCHIFAELVKMDNVPAARLAGGAGTFPVLTHRLVSEFMADTLTFPEATAIYEQLLSSTGHEIYTCYYGTGLLDDAAPPKTDASFAEIITSAHEDHGVLMLGTLCGPPDSAEKAHCLVPSAPRLPSDLRGFFGLSANFEQLKAAVLATPLTPSAPATDLPPLPAVTIQHERRELKRVLICGFHEGLVDLCEQLIGHCPGLQIFMMVPGSQQVETLARRLRNNAVFQGLRAPSQAKEILADDAPPLTVHCTAGATIHLMVGDWSERDSITRDRGDYRLSQIEAILFSFTATDHDPDARTALASLKLLDLATHSPEQLHPELQALCEVLDTDRADLFASHFSARQDQPPHMRAVCTEHLRHAFMAQAVFAPGIADIYDDLLGCGGRQILKLKFQPEAGTTEEAITFGRLAAALYQRDGLLPIAVECPSQGGTRITVNPAQPLALGDIRAFYAIGSVAGSAPRRNLDEMSD